VALKWIGAVLLVGGIMVGLVVLPWAGLALALAGVATLSLGGAREEDDGGDGGGSSLSGGAGDAGGGGAGA
jgi:uncharacterized membrane protein YgcG